MDKGKLKKPQEHVIKQTKLIPFPVLTTKYIFQIKYD